MTKTSKRSRFGEISDKYIGLSVSTSLRAPIQVEQIVIGGIIAESRILPTIQEYFRPEYFSSERLQVVAQAILSLYNSQRPIDLITVGQELKSKGALAKAGGNAGITELIIGVGSNVNIESHMRLVQQNYLERRTADLCESVLRSVVEGKDVFECLDHLANGANTLATGASTKGFSDMETLHQDFVERKKAERKTNGVTGVPSGIIPLDRITGGWKKGRMITIAARPAMGKSAFMLTLARNAAVMFNKPVAIFSNEMASDENYTRLITAEYNGYNLDHARLEDEELDKIGLNEMVLKLRNAPIYIDDSPNMSIFELRSKARKIKKEKGIEMIMIDYLQLMSGEGDEGNREQEISKISRSIKGLSKELDIPIIALSQLSRAVELRGGDKKPMLSDLRESGSIEQDSDVVGFLWRPEYYGITDIDGESTEGLTHVIIAKHRGGRVGYVELNFIAELTKFTEKKNGFR